jgi:anti-sigma-K factor RskA
VKWYESPRTLKVLAASYALGTLSGPARRRFEAVMKAHPAAAQAVADWNRRFEPLAQQLPPVQASVGLWARIEQDAFGAMTSAAHPAAARRQRAASHLNPPASRPRGDAG